MPSLIEFLQHVLPSEGFKCWVAIRDGKVQQGFTQSFEELADILQRIDAAGSNAYFACSTYKEPVNRKKENIKTAKSFWLDIDAGPDKPYPDDESAIDALDAFCDRMELPYPTVVYSGYGIHAYWTGAKGLEPAEWNAAASKFKLLVTEGQLRADPARTADGASILRAPATHNFKIPDAPRIVECLELAPCEDIFDIMPGSDDIARPSGELSAVPEFPAQFSAVNTNAANVYEDRPAYASLCVSQCGQLARFRDTQGNIPEPEWYAGLCVLAHCADGEETAHAWSRGYPAYTHVETSRKFNQAKSNSGPTTCQRYASLNPAGCRGCPHVVSSPIQLGRPAPAIAGPAAGAVNPAWPYFIPPGFQFENDRLKARTTIDGKEAWVMIADFPITLIEVRDGENQREQGYLFMQREPKKGDYIFEMTASEYEGMSCWGILAKHGIRVPDNGRKLFRSYMFKIWAHLVREKGQNMRYDQFGWKDENRTFYVAGELFLSDGTRTPAAGSIEVMNRSKKMIPSKYGSLTAWTAAANKLFMEGCESQSFALLASFAAPLIQFVTPKGEGGAVISLLSPGGGTGKSTILTAIASVWGELDAIRLLSRDTMVAKFRSIATLCNLPIIFEELRHRDPDVIKEFIESFTTGRDRLRGRTDGSVIPTEFSWRTIVVSASNKSLLDALNDRGEDPLSTRVFEVETKLPKEAEFSLGSELSEELLLNRGYAGRAYIDYLLQPGVVEFAKANMDRLLKHYTDQLGAKPMHRFQLRLLAAVGVAASLVRHIGLIEFNDQRIVEWALDEIGGIIKSGTQFDATRTIADLINSYAISDCLVVDDAFHPRRQTIIRQKPSRELHMRYEVIPNRLFISAAWVRQKLTQEGKPCALIAGTLEKEGILINRARITSLGAGSDITSGKTPCWEIDMSQPAIGEISIKEVLPLGRQAM